MIVPFLRQALKTDPRSLAQLARQADIHDRTLHGFLDGVDSRYSTVKAIAKVLGYSIEIGKITP